MNKWRLMKSTDFELRKFIELTYEVWPNHWESPETLIARYHLCPKGFWMYYIDNNPRGYLMSHPGYLGTPPKLNEYYLLDKGTPTCYHIHDAAIVESARGNHAVDKIWPTVLKLAKDYTHISLVAVDDTEPFWSRFGFVKDKKIRGYGTYMLKAL